MREGKTVNNEAAFSRTPSVSSVFCCVLVGLGAERNYEPLLSLFAVQKVIIPLQQVGNTCPPSTAYTYVCMYVCVGWLLARLAHTRHPTHKSQPSFRCNAILAHCPWVPSYETQFTSHCEATRVHPKSRSPQPHQPCQTSMLARERERVRNAPFAHGIQKLNTATRWGTSFVLFLGGVSLTLCAGFILEKRKKNNLAVAFALVKTHSRTMGICQVSRGKNYSLTMRMPQSQHPVIRA